jgi:dienelactone hydrolase
MHNSVDYFRFCLRFGLLGWVVLACGGAAVDPRPLSADTPERLRALNPRVLRPDESLRSMLRDDARRRLQAANQQSTEDWQAVASRRDWEQLRDEKLAALRSSLGRLPESPGNLTIHTTGVLEGDGFRIRKLVFESRPGLWVTAHLYAPAAPANAMPGLILCHSHHNPKTQGELQDMGMTWARQGCLVLVMDQLGHGERRQHPFRTGADYDGSFQPGRQDYYFRYNVGLQLHLVGESLMGWMVWDLMRGVDLLLAEPGIDAGRIVLLGAVAGGGDPAAVTAALDSRITAVVPFNFGGPQPETRFPLPDDADESFNYAGGGSWESTRNLRFSARDGFLPWVIVGGVAPRRLIYAHEFSWDQPRDPVWKRLHTIYSFYEATDSLAFAHGFGRLSGRPPAASHCNNIGSVHRKMIYPVLERWFQIPAPQAEFQQRRSADDLLCLSGAEVDDLDSKPVHQLADQRAQGQISEFRRQLQSRSLPEQRQALRSAWSRILGDCEPYPIRRAELRGMETVANIRIERRLLHGEDDVRLPMLLLIPDGSETARVPLVVAVAEFGNSAFLEHRADLLAALLDGSVAVCLPDLRGCGESRPGDDRGRRSAATAISATELMLGRTLVGLQLQDLRSVLSYLRRRPEFDVQRIALYGDSFAPVNADERPVEVPLDAAQPQLAAPLGALWALLGGLFEEDLAVVSARGGLASFRSALQSQFLHHPHAVMIPGVFMAGDLPDLAAVLTPRPVWIAHCVDGLNRRVPAAEASRIYASAGNAPLVVSTDRHSDQDLAAWLLKHLSD